MGKKYTGIHINIINNPLDQDLTFVSDPMKELILRYSNQHENNNAINSNDSTKKMVRKLDTTLDFRKVIFEISQSKDCPNKIIRLSTNDQLDISLLIDR